MSSVTGTPSPLAPGVSVVVPVFNSQTTLPRLVLDVTEVLEQCRLDHEFVLVDDGSRDASWDVIEQLALTRPTVRGVKMMRNYGQHNAVLAGVRAARFDVIVTLDDDLQHPATEIPSLLDALRPDVDVVYGAPRDLPHSAIRNFLSRFTKWSMAKAMGVPNIADISAFRVFRTRLRDAFASYNSPQILLDVLLSWGTTRFTTVYVRHDPRQAGRSNYTFGRLVNQAMLVLTGFSTGPLRLATVVGFTFTALGAILLLYVLTTYFIFGTAIRGFAFLASAITLFSGAQLFALGILGEYIGRIFNRSMDRPPYVVASQIDVGAALERSCDDRAARS